MPDRDFEKQVQLKMDELKLRPSDAVWAGVEKNLRREKRRRRAILWLPLLGLLMVTGGYFVFTGGKQSSQSTLANRESRMPATQDINNESTTTDNNNATGQNKQSGNTTINSEKASQPAVAATRNTADQQNRQSNNDTGNMPHNTLAQKNSGNKTANNTTSEKTPVSRKAVVPQPDDHVPANNNQTIIAIEPAPVSSEEKLLYASAVADINSYAMPLVTAEMALTPSTVAAKKIKKPSGWQWGVQAHTGVTNMAEGDLFNLFRAARVEDLSYNDQGMPSMGFTGFGPAPAPEEPSPLEAGPSLSLGFYVKRQLSKKISLSAGLQYSYFSLRTTVGAQVDSLVTVNVGANSSQFTSRYYLNNSSASDTREYTNRYHFIELPVTVSIQLNNSARLPITWDAGVAASRMLYTNALHYDGVRGVYYNNKDIFNKTQLLVSSGLTVGLFQQGKHPVFIGPGIKYYATRLVNREISDGQHLWSAGLNMKMLLKK